MEDPKQPSRREKAAMKKAVAAAIPKKQQLSLPSLPQDQEEREAELRKRSSRFARTQVKLGRDENGKDPDVC